MADSRLIITMNKDAKIYLAGHDGLVGSAIYEELVKQGFKNIIIKSFLSWILEIKPTQNFFQKKT